MLKNKVELKYGGAYIDNTNNILMENIDIIGNESTFSTGGVFIKESKYITA